MWPQAISPCAASTPNFTDPLHGIVAIPDAKDSTKVDAFIVGPEDTPYAGGLFVFRVAFPADYPAQAPKVKLLTTGGGTVRFNPNLYMNGKVCLSILGTWSGPGWSSSQSLASVLLSIQSLLNAHPAHNEPGFSATSSKIEAYDAVIAHETLRVAVLGALQDPASALPAQLVDAALEMACSNASVFAKTAKKWAHMDGKQFADPFANNVGGQNKGVFNFTGLSADIADRCAQLHGSASDSEHSDTSSGSDSDDDTTGQP